MTQASVPLINLNDEGAYFNILTSKKKKKIVKIGKRRKRECKLDVEVRKRMYRLHTTCINIEVQLVSI